MSFVCHAQHYLGVGATMDIPLALDKLAFTNMTISGGGEINGVYAYQYKHFTVQTGVDIGMQCPRLRLKDESLEQAMVDTRGVPFIYRGSLVSRVDMSRQFGIGVPLMLGYAGEYVYAIAGARYYNILYAQTYSTAKLQTIGDYDGRYYDPFEDMPEHGYHTYEPVKSKGSIKFKHDVQACAEIGGIIPLDGSYSSRYNSNVLRLSVWAAYSLLSITPSNTSDKHLTEVDYSQYMQVELTHPYNAIEGKDSNGHNLCIGIRATFLFGIADSSHSRKACRCLNN